MVEKSILKKLFIFLIVAALFYQVLSATVKEDNSKKFIDENYSIGALVTCNKSDSTALNKSIKKTIKLLKRKKLFKRVVS
jgi:hypothetical protein